MAFKIQKEDKRKTQQISFSAPAALYEDIVVWSQIAESSVSHTVIEILREACKQNRAGIDKWKVDNKSKLSALMKPERDRGDSSEKAQQTTDAVLAATYPSGYNGTHRETNDA